MFMAREQDSRDPRIYLAAERTFLAWIRTGLALMGFGFVVARFGLFLRELAAAGGGSSVATSNFSLPLGTALVVIGVVVDILAAVQHIRFVRVVNQGGQAVGNPSKLGLAVAFVLAAAGLAMAAYLASGPAKLGLIAIKKGELTGMNAGDGIISKASKYSVSETLDRLERILRGNGITVFARVDHSGEAEKVGMKMPPTQLLIFGNPKAGTPAMLAAPTSAIDLPVKALAWQDGDGKVWLGYNDVEHFKRRFGLADDAVKGIAAAGTLIEQAVN
jgi:uncharacterized protein (DUF302 family)/uncharacterized membrane protein YidH (DUF202 family)